MENERTCDFIVTDHIKEMLFFITEVLISLTELHVLSAIISQFIITMQIPQDRTFYFWVDSPKIENLFGFLFETTQHNFSPDVSVSLHRMDHMRRFITQQILILFSIGQ